MFLLNPSMFQDSEMRLVVELLRDLEDNVSVGWLGTRLAGLGSKVLEGLGWFTGYIDSVGKVLNKETEVDMASFSNGFANVASTDLVELSVLISFLDH